MFRRILMTCNLCNPRLFCDVVFNVTLSLVCLSVMWCHVLLPLSDVLPLPWNVFFFCEIFLVQNIKLLSVNADIRMICFENYWYHKTRLTRHVLLTCVYQERTLAVLVFECILGQSIFASFYVFPVDFRIVPTSWLDFRIVPTAWLFVVFHFILVWSCIKDLIQG